jgi:alpha-mannosidase
LRYNASTNRQNPQEDIDMARRSHLGKDMMFDLDKMPQRVALLEQYIYRFEQNVEEVRFCEGQVPGGEAPALDDSAWARIQPGHVWGQPNGYAWFRLPLRIPAGWAGQRVAVVLDVGGLGSGGFAAECLAYLDGAPHQGVDRNHHDILLAERAQGGESWLLAIEAFSGVYLHDHHFAVAKLVVIDEPTYQLYWDLKVAYEALTTMSENSLTRQRLAALLNDTVNQLDLSFADVPLAAGITATPHVGEPRWPNSTAFYTSVAEAGATFRQRMAAEFAAEEREKILMVGHAHIDVGWLWPVAQSRKKVGRTFSTALELMKRYPDYCFFQSQPVLYQFTKEEYPSLYEGIKARVAEGRWEPNGATWVEMDTNVPCGESLVRQFLFGKRYFQREFGYDSRVLWLPDVFGYSWSLPQIMKKAGVDYFMTTKISWNEYNEIPFDVFQWRGVDGSEVLTQFITTVSGAWFYTYNGQLEPVEVRSAWDNFKGKDRTDEVMLSFGYGDGGGGPTQEMLENASRLKAMPDFPRARMGRIDAFFDRLAHNGHQQHTWNGELYFEYHRGTYTTQARTKKGNRLSERALMDAEHLAALAWLQGWEYPAQEINACWELLLTNQFHDILPGSSISLVYEVAEEEYRQIQARMGTVQQGAMRHLLRQAACPQAGVAVFNTLSWQRDDVLALPRTTAGLLDGVMACPTQDVVDLDGQAQTLAMVHDVPSKGVKLLANTPSRPGSQAELHVSERTLENRFFRIALDDRGQISSIYDKRAQREVLPQGAVANQFQIFEDRPLAHDAWDINIFYGEKQEVVDQLDAITVVECGPVRAAVEIVRSFGRSRLRQRLCIYADLPRIDFQTEIDWQERRRMLKVAFPVDVRANEASFEIQFGTIQRPTHWSSSWDWAKFEVCAQRWADLSEGDFGASLLNDCKYGHDAKDGVLRLTVLRSPMMPDSQADLGRHTLTYALYPHLGDWAAGGTPRAAAELNQPLLAMPAEAHDGQPLTEAFVWASRDDVVIDTLKKAEDRDELVVRLYENANRRGPVTLTFARPLASAALLDLLENVEQPLTVQGNQVRLDIAPYELVTLGITFAEKG